MSYNLEKWHSRLSERIDLTASVVHLTKATDDMNISAVVAKILSEKRLIGSTTNSGFICGKTPAVCFQDAPIYSISQNVYYEQKSQEPTNGGKVRYSPAGFVFKKDFIFAKGGRPVIYEKRETAKKLLPKNEYWRIVNFDLTNQNEIIDWTHEREWRVPGDLEFEYSDLRLFINKPESIRLVRKYLEEKIKIDIFDELGGIICATDILR